MNLDKPGPESAKVFRAVGHGVDDGHGDALLVGKQVVEQLDLSLVEVVELFGRVGEIAVVKVETHGGDVRNNIFLCLSK